MVIGSGEVGGAIAEVLALQHDTHIRDIVKVGPDHADVLHICFPWSESFIEHVREYVIEYGPSLVIVHSTVPVGTCEELEAVHSPVRGRHPFLADSIRTFVKFFGGPGAERAAAIFSACGVPTRTVADACVTEAGKLWELAQYGVNILVEKAIWSYCQDNGIDFDVVYGEFARTYNDGYKAMGDEQFVRPVLRHVPGPIGGHCVLQNVAHIDHPLARWVAHTRDCVDCAP